MGMAPIFLLSLFFLYSLVSGEVYAPAPLGDNKWYTGSATFYSFIGNSGYCGYPWGLIRSINHAAVPNPRFSDSKTYGVNGYPGVACGQCYKLKCLRKPRYANLVYCTGNAEILVRITDWDVPRKEGWPLNHFDLGREGFSKIANPKAGIINIQFKRVACPGNSPKWTRYPRSNNYWHSLGAFDIPGVGNIYEFWIKPTGENQWYKCKTSWGSRFTLYTGKKHIVDSRSRVKVVLAENRRTLTPKFTYNNQ